MHNFLLSFVQISLPFLNENKGKNDKIPRKTILIILGIILLFRITVLCVELYEDYYRKTHPTPIQQYLLNREGYAGSENASLSF